MGQREKHPPGLYVLFFTEMWERFGFYSMLAMFTLYLQNKDQGFGWTKAQATELYSNYLMFVYASPLLGGWLADWKLGYRNSVLLGGLIFMVGYFLLAVHSLEAVYAALTLLVIGNGFFKPNVSAMVGHLYPDGSSLKDRAYNIFYMGINIGALLAPINAEFMVHRFGYHPAFAVAGVGMVVSVAILWTFKHFVESAHQPPPSASDPERAARPVPRQNPIDAVPDRIRIGALIVIFLIVIVFWMMLHQNGSTLTYWANENTDWKVSGIISNAINPFWVVTLTFPVVWFWQWLDRKGLEPATPTKMAIGMLLTAGSFFILYLAARTGEATVSGENPYQFKVSPLWLICSYAVVTLGELMLSPMGLSLVSKVAPVRLRGLMMGGWFVATAIGNKLTMIGVFWEEWLHSTFFAVLGGMALVTAVVLFLLLKPLKKAMPGV
jgi:POT family proton-dependent oligopeptide transporter